MANPPDSNCAPILISGAGPSGLMLALWLSKYSVPYRIIDKAVSPFQTSRAIVMHARMIEFYRMLGLEKEIIERGTQVSKFNIVAAAFGGRRKGTFNLVNSGKGQTYYPFVLSITQDEHEDVLLRKLEEIGTRVERGVEVVGMDYHLEKSSKDSNHKDDSDDDEGEDDYNHDVVVSLRSVDDGKEENLKASYVIGCDGAHSGVRHTAGIPMQGGTYTRSFFVADVFCHGDMRTQGEVNACLSQYDLVWVLPLPNDNNRARLIGLVPAEYEHSSDITFEHCRPSVAKCAPRITIDDVRWFAIYKVHHRCAEVFQYKKRVFLCGDSAHLHSPLGGQGMNTGLGDVSNLAWKLATAWHATSVSRSMDTSHGQELLSTYSSERKPFAELLIRTTDRYWQIIIAHSVLGWVFRNIVLPHVLPFFINTFNAVRSRAFRRVSQIGIEYTSSALNQGGGQGSAMPGKRLPWIEHPGGSAGDADNHSLLDGQWQVHIFEGLPKTTTSLEQLKHKMVPVYSFPLTADAERCGFLSDTMYLIRPDGHIGLVTSFADGEHKLPEYTAKWGVKRIGLEY